MSILRNEEFVGETSYLISLFSLNAEQSCQHCHSGSNSMLPLSEPFMSLLLVLSHMEFKLNMEVRAGPLFILLKTKNVLYTSVFSIFKPDRILLQNITLSTLMPIIMWQKQLFCQNTLKSKDCTHTSGLFTQNCSFLDESWLLPVRNLIII